jgi:hypothetical protein
MPSNFSFAIAILVHLRSRFSMHVFSAFLSKQAGVLNQGILKGGSITVLLTSCLTGLKSAVRLQTIFVFIYKTG